MAKENLDNLPPHDRRRFFAAGLARMLRPLADALEERLPMHLPVFREHLRPPGAIGEADFLETCMRCGACADACPAHAIELLDTLDDRLRNTPVVEPTRQACVVCDELACMKVCPSGALRLVDRLAIRMGLARVKHDVCVRSNGDDCTECLDRCPLGETAIRLDDDGRVHVVDPARDGTGCTGCGVCEQHCPTTPTKAIRIYPY